MVLLGKDMGRDAEIATRVVARTTKLTRRLCGLFLDSRRARRAEGRRWVRLVADPGDRQA